MTFAAFAVVVLISWLQTAFLLRATLRFPGIKTLRERAFTAVWISVAATIFLCLIANTETGWPVLDRNGGMIATRLIFATVVLGPASRWLWLYYRGGFARDPFREGEDEAARNKREAGE